MFHDSRLSHIIARASVSSDTMQNLEDLDDRRLNPEIREASFAITKMTRSRRKK
jgi:hypothetical protein